MAGTDQSMSSSYRLAVDIGGTFTDVVLQRATQRITTKVLTTIDDPADAVMIGIDQVLEIAGARPNDASVVLHGTTLATNALIQRSGATTALLTTQGHRDAVEMALENRFEQYDLDIDRPTPLVPRHLRLPVQERLDARGEVLLRLDEQSVIDLLPVLEQYNVASAAIGFLHSYVNPLHEQRVAQLLQKYRPEMSITLSCDVCPEIREYERLSTACANAYVKPLMASYLTSLRDRLDALDLTCPVLLMTSGGGLTTLETACEFPIRLVESGPAGGAILAAHIAQANSCAEVLSFDMGGTTAKLCVIDDGEPLLSRSFEVDRSYRFKKGSGLPVRIPVIEMVEIGAGGGSLAHVDKLGRLQVGPASAGSVPGPACYGQGGDRPAVTDADLLLGKLDPMNFAGGGMQLDESAAERAVDKWVGEPMSLSTQAAAHGISEVVNENMSSAARAHLAEWGKAMNERVLIAFGGAAPLHAALLAHKLKIDRVIVPMDAGVGSAVGFLIAPVRYEVVRSRYMQLAALDASAVDAVMAEMRSEAHSVVASVADEAELVESRSAYMRYVGQGYEIAVVLPAAEGPLQSADLRQRFEAAYRKLYGRTIPDLEVEILSWTLTLSAPPPVAVVTDSLLRNKRASADSTRRLFDVVIGDDVEAQCYRREDLEPGAYLEGPALVVEDQTTTFVATGFSACVSTQNHLVLERQSGTSTHG